MLASARVTGFISAPPPPSLRAKMRPVLILPSCTCFSGRARSGATAKSTAPPSLRVLLLKARPGWSRAPSRYRLPSGWRGSWRIWGIGGLPSLRGSGWWWWWWRGWCWWCGWWSRSSRKSGCGSGVFDSPVQSNASGCIDRDFSGGGHFSGLVGDCFDGHAVARSVVALRVLWHGQHCQAPNL